MTLYRNFSFLQILHSILLGHFTPHFMPHFHQEVFPQITVWLCVYCLTLCNAMDCSPPVSSVPGISRQRILEWQEYWSVLPFPFPMYSLLMTQEEPDDPMEEQQLTSENKS